MGKLEELVAGAVATGIEPGGRVTVVAAAWHGDQAVTLAYRDGANQVDTRHPRRWPLK